MGIIDAQNSCHCIGKKNYCEIKLLLVNGNGNRVQATTKFGFMISMDNHSPLWAKKILALAVRAKSIKLKTMRQYLKPGLYHHLAGNFIQIKV